jgi:hypothetical protein
MFKIAGELLPFVFHGCASIGDNALSIFGDHQMSWLAVNRVCAARFDQCSGSDGFSVCLPFGTLKSRFPSFTFLMGFRTRTITKKMK